MKVLYFGVIAEKTNLKEEDFDSELVISELVGVIKTKYSLEMDFKLALNKKIIDRNSNQLLSSDDVLAVLPAFSGG
jgi:molybdopterin converting factor small subunit